MFRIDEHPLDQLMLVFKKYKVSDVELSIYQYHPQTIEDDRIVERVHVCNLQAKLKRLYSQLSAGEEIALNSRVHLADGSIGHIPMIDYLTDAKDTVFSVSASLMREKHWANFFLYNSGRSYHLYADTIVSQLEWYRFMGRILLVNPPNSANIVDTRWVGHCLMSGYSSLRWSWNSPHYVNPPTFSGMMSSLYGTL